MLTPLEFHVLLVEDSPTDAKLVARALREDGAPHRLTVIADGRRALDYLDALRDPAAEPALVPDLVLLDLNLPGIDGHQVLSRIKGDAVLRAIPVVVLTTTRREQEVLQTYRAGANTFFQKPAEFGPYRDLIATLRRYWADLAVRPVLHPDEATAAGPALDPR